MEEIQISKIKPYDNNAKKHPKKQIKQIAESIKRFGFGQCIVLDKNLNVVIGHGRLLAAKELGWKTARLGIARAKKGEEFVPAVLADDLTEEEIIAYRLADNKLNESPWDMDLAIEDLKLLDEDLINLTGFSLDLALEPEERDDEVPEIPEEPEAKIGELYKLGNHRLFCGDATNPDHIEKLMRGKKADMVFTDPPYNVNYSGRGKKTKNKILNDNMAEEEFEEFLTKAFQSYKEAATEKTPFYICHSSSSQAIFERAMAKTNLLVKNQIIWNKTIASMGWGDYRWKHEPIFYATYGKKDVNFYGNRSEYTVWDESWDLKKIEKHLKSIAKKQEKGNSTIWTLSRDSNYAHPTQKPVELIITAIKNSSERGNMILDLFGGSGSALIACEKSKRICYMMELDPKYIDAIIKRYEKYTSEKAEKISK